MLWRKRQAPCGLWLLKSESNSLGYLKVQKLHNRKHPWPLNNSIPVWQVIPLMCAGTQVKSQTWQEPQRCPHPESAQQGHKTHLHQLLGQDGVAGWILSQEHGGDVLAVGQGLGWEPMVGQARCIEELVHLGRAVVIGQERGDAHTRQSPKPKALPWSSPLATPAPPSTPTNSKGPSCGEQPLPSAPAGPGDAYGMP